MNRNGWQDWNGAIGRPTMRVGDRVRIQHIDGRTEVDTLHDPATLCWGFVKRYLIVPEMNEERLERELEAMTVERDALEHEQLSLLAQLESMGRLAMQTGTELTAAREEARELGECVARLCAEVHDISYNFAEYITATHAGIKRGIALGELPGDYYARFSTTWAPKK